MRPLVFSKKDTLALDFDGVIADSIEECLVVGYNAFVDYSRQESKIETLSALDKKVVDEAKRLRHFIRSGEDYVYIQLALSEDIKMNTQDDFDNFLNKYSQLKETFFNLFYQERKHFSVEKLNSWMQLNPMYEGMQHFLKESSGKNPLYIISTKKSEYIHKILEGHQITFPVKNIFHAHKDRSKLTIIHELLSKYNTEPSHFHFIDDQVDTLLKVELSQVHRYLAGWGYNNEEQKTRAIKAGIPVLRLIDFYSIFNPAH